MFERLSQGSSRCEETRSCADIADRFEGLDLKTLCATRPKQTERATFTKRTRDVQATVAGKPLKCRVTQHTLLCSVTCFDPLPATDLDAAYSAQERYIQFVRDTYGAERFADVQGHPSFPRYNYRWRSGETSLQIVVTLSDPSSANARNEIRTHYHTRRRAPWSH